MDSGQWTVENGQWTVGSVQWAITVGRGQWTFKFGLAMFGSITKYSLYFTSNIRLKRKFPSGPDSFRLWNLLIRFDAKQANKTILFASKRINIRLYSLQTEYERRTLPTGAASAHRFAYKRRAHPSANNISFVFYIAPIVLVLSRSLPLHLLFQNTPINWVELTGNGNKLKTRWRLTLMKNIVQCHGLRPIPIS